MSTEPIKEVLDSGKCPVCGKGIATNKTMTAYYCAEDTSHFNLEVEFHGGENMSATLNGKPVPQDELDKLEW